LVGPGDAVEVDVLREAAALGVGLDVERVPGGVGDALVRVDVADAAGQLAAAAHRAPRAVHGAAHDDDVLGRRVDAPSVGVAARLDRDVVVAGAERAVADHHVVAALGVAAVGVGAGDAGGDRVDGDVGAERGVELP